MTTPQERYEKENIRRFVLKLSRNTDAEMIAFLAGKDNIQGYIKQLIRSDMDKSCNKSRYPSCPYSAASCSGCSASNYGLDCHNIPIDKPPHLTNTVGYPMPFMNGAALAALISSGDFPEEQINQLLNDIQNTEI